MTEGVNMGRKCPWTKEFLRQLYHKLNMYCKVITFETLRSEGQKAAKDTMAAYNMFKFPVAYVFIHYHYGKFEDLEMDNNDISMYMFYLMGVKEFTTGFLEGLAENVVFERDKNNELSPALISICKEILYIEENF